MKRPLIALVLAQALSLAGTRLSTVAIPWLVLTTTGDPVLTGLVGLAEMLPYVVAKGLGGPWVDRFGARTVSLWCDLASIVAVGIIPVLQVLGLLTLPVLLPLVAVMGVLRGPADVAKSSLVPEVARLVDLRLERVTGAMGAVERLASTVGAAAAGVLIAMIGAGPALIFNAATFGLSVLVVLWGLPRTRPAGATNAPYRRQLGEGWTFLRHEPVLMGIVLMVMITNLFDQAHAVVMLPVWVQTHGHDAAVLGMLLAVTSAASIAGSVLAGATGERLPRLLVYTIAYLIVGLPRFAVFAFDAPLALIISVLVIGGFASGFLNPILSAISFERIPQALVGRVTALIGALAWALIPFGGLAGGALIAGFGLEKALLIAGGCYFVVTLMPLAVPSFRQFDRPPLRSAGE